MVMTIVRQRPQASLWHNGTKYLRVTGWRHNRGEEVKNIADEKRGDIVVVWARKDYYPYYAAYRPVKKESDIRVAWYHWGKFQGYETIPKSDLAAMEELSSDVKLGFDIRSEDENKTFYALESSIDEDDEGISVKNSYATSKKMW